MRKINVTKNIFNEKRRAILYIYCVLVYLRNVFVSEG